MPTKERKISRRQALLGIGAGLAAGGNTARAAMRDYPELPPLTPQPPIQQNKPYYT